MSFKIKLADTTDLVDNSFKLRHHVFAEEEGLLKATTEGRLFDRFDAYPTTRILILTTKDKVVGTLRMVHDSSEGLPADEYYDFRKHLPENSNLMHIGYFCISGEHRSSRLTAGLTLMSAYYAVSQGVTHIVAPINPKIARLLKRIGFVALGDEFIEPHTGVPMLPLLLNVIDFNDFFSTVHQTEPDF